MKRLLVILLAVVLVLGVSACGKKEEAKAGGWTDAEKTELTAEESEIFAAAIAGTEYEGYEAVALLGTQVVAGTNYKFQVKDLDGNEKTMVVYRDLQKNCSVLSVE